jgi:histidinol-phosphate aminotransferase
MYPHLAALSGAREVRVPLADGDVHDLEAMLEEITAATQLLLVCNPNNPTSTHIPAAEIAAFVERVPSHVTVILDEAYAEFQGHDDPDAGVDLTKRFPNLVVLRTFSKVYGLAGLRCGYAIGSTKFRAAVDAVRQPRRFAIRTTLPSASSARSSNGSSSRPESPSSASRRPDRRPISPGSTSATATRRRWSAGSDKPGSSCAPVRPSAARATFA